MPTHRNSVPGDVSMIRAPVIYITIVRAPNRPRHRSPDAPRRPWFLHRDSSSVSPRSRTPAPLVHVYMFHRYLGCPTGMPQRQVRLCPRNRSALLLTRIERIVIVFAISVKISLKISFRFDLLYAFYLPQLSER